MKSAMKALGRAVIQVLRVPSCAISAFFITMIRSLTRHRLFLIMGHIDGRQAKALLDLADFLAHMAAQLGVKVGQRFVQQQHLGFQHDGARHRDALLLAARQFRRQPRAKPLQPHQFQPRLGAGLHLGLAQAA
jgi:hypothetical protein